MIKDSDLGPSATTDDTLNLKDKMYSNMVVFFSLQLSRMQLMQ